jgi:hypothetical protein
MRVDMDADLFQLRVLQLFVPRGLYLRVENDRHGGDRVSYGGGGGAADVSADSDQHLPTPLLPVAICLLILLLQLRQNNIKVK